MFIVVYDFDCVVVVEEDFLDECLCFDFEVGLV